MQDYFNSLVDHLATRVRGTEVFTLSLQGEESDFVRFNQARVRQAGHVQQRMVRLTLIEGQRQARADATLTEDFEMDRSLLGGLLTRLREQLPILPEDPHLLYSTEVRSTERISQNQLPPPAEVLEEVTGAAAGQDFVGIYAHGGIHHGFANSLGQRNWFSSYSYNLDWSLYHHADKAVKSSYAGFTWDSMVFEDKMQRARDELRILRLTPQNLDPGCYRVYLSPSALYEILGMLSWGGFGLKNHKTKQTPLLRMLEEGATLHPSVTILEHTADGVAPDFEDAGFIRPASVPLIRGGALTGCLVSPRSAREYQVPTNGASHEEAPESLDVVPGDLPLSNIVSELHTGVFINNLWYLNYSDRPAGRITGMTRFATFWVEKGRVMAPVNVMRFDETIFRVLGERLQGLTRERDFLLDSHTYGHRSTSSGRLPGALVDDFTFTM